MALQVQGKTALVTGGGSGICLAFAELLLSNECNVLVADLQLTPEAEEIITRKRAEDLKARVVFKKTDVTDWAQLQAAFDAAISEFGSLDIVCPGAGVFEPAWSTFWRLEGTADIISNNSYKTLDINITHPIRTTQLAIDYFRRQKLGHGVVVNVSSIAAQIAIISCPLYAASKAAISSFTRSMEHLEPTLNIRVNAVAPGIVKTPIWKAADKLDWFSDVKDTWITPQTIARAMLELVQNQEYVGGTILEVSGEGLRKVDILNDPGFESKKGMTISNAEVGYKSTYELIQSQFGK